MRKIATFSLLLLAVLSTPTVAQLDEAEPYFTISTEKTYGSGDKPQIRLWGRGIAKLQFRVYRVSDTSRFFRELEDPNRFGGVSHRPPSQLTAIERYHRWKRSARSWMRNLVRRQYTPESREVIRDAMAKRSAATRKVTTATPAEYANVPLLNKQQVLSVWEQTFQAANPWESQTIPVDVSGTGVYLVEATDGQRQAYTIVCLSDLILLTKTGEGGMLSRVVNRNSGLPVGGAQIVGWSNKQEVIRAESDASGFATLNPTGAPAEGIMLLALKGSDVAPVAISEWELRSLEAKSSLTAYTYTDRPVYRPGHQVHYRAIVRAARSLGYDLPSTGEIDIQIEDPEGKSMLRRSVRPDANGSISGDLTLPATAALGYYSISIRSGEQYVGNTGFNVEEYRKPEYEVRVTPQTPRVLQGETVRATINARYYFGEPVPGAKVTWVVHRSRYWPPYYMEEMDDAVPSETEDEYLGNEQILEQTGQLDANGVLNVEFPSEKTGQDLRYRIEARVTDQANREVSGTGYLLATRARFFIHAEPERYVYEPGDQARIRVECRDYDGKPVPNVPFTIQLVTGGKTKRVIANATGRTDLSGNGSADVRVVGGSLQAQVTAKDTDGRETGDTTYLWVSGGASDYGRQGRIEIVPDQKSYKDGDTAKILIVTGVPDASVWVTTESRGVISSQVVQAKNSSATFDLPIRADYAPNVFVNATFIRDGQMYAGSKSIKVPPVDQKIDVSLTASKPQFTPGERGVYTIEAKDPSGKPVNAAFSLGVVDEAIYAIRREAVPDILSFFYGRRYDAVNTSSSLHYSFYGASGKRRMQLAALHTGRRSQIKPEKFVDPRVRKAFPDTIYWVADVRTGPSGRVQIPVEFPDALTTWRATTRGITADTRVGSAVDRTIVRKNLILRLTVPRFFTQGDEVTVAAIVQNYLADTKTVRVSLEAKGVELIDGGTRDLTVPSRGTAQVEYRVRATSPGSAVLLGKALTNEESDALELTVPVNPYGVKLSDSRSGSIDSATEAAAQLSFPAAANPASRTIEVTLSPSIAGTLFSALDYLTTFPYGCTEQIMSSFLPNVIVSRAAKDLGIQSGLDEAALLRKIRAGLDLLYGYQHEDGGWGWWHSDDSTPFMTAYVAAGLAQAQDAGYKIKPEALSKAIDWLKKQEASPDLRAYIAYALALANAQDPAYLQSVWDKRSSLSPYGTALLGLALHQAKDGRASELAARLERDARSNDREAWWEMKSDTLLEVPVDSSSEATAFALKFLAVARPESPLLPKAALYLVNHRDQGYYWSSTKQTAMVIFGLTDYLKVSKELQPDFTASVTVNGSPAGTKRFTAADALSPGFTIRVPAASADNKIQIVKSGAGRLYWSARADYYSTAEKEMKPGSGVLGITREYFKLAPQQKEGKVVYRLDPLGDTVEKGDILAVRVVVKGTEWNYLLTEDPIPSGTEFLPRDDLYELENKPDWWARWFSRREFHDDRMALFQRYFPSGQSEQSYLLKVTNSGKFRVPPARVAPMYQPGAYSTSDARVLEVK